MSAPEIDPKRYLLSEAQARQIFINEIVPDHLAHAQEQSQPVLALIAGQPGAGKTSLTERVTESFEVMGGVVAINSDTYKPYHPQWETLLQEDDTTAVTFTRMDGRRWMAMAQEWCRDHHVNALIETTMQDSTLFEQPLHAFREAGWVTETIVLAVPEPLSRLGILERYVDQRQEHGNGRLTETTAHDAAYLGVERGVRSAEDNKITDRLSIWRRGDDLEFANRLDHNQQWVVPPKAVQELNRIRQETLRYGEAIQALTSYDKIRQALPGTEWEAPLAEVKQLLDPQIPLTAKAAHLVNISTPQIPLTNPLQRTTVETTTKLDLTTSHPADIGRQI